MCTVNGCPQLSKPHESSVVGIVCCPFAVQGSHGSFTKSKFAHY